MIEVQRTPGLLAETFGAQCWCDCEHCADSFGKCGYKITSDDSSDDVFCNFCRANCGDNHKMLWPREFPWPATAAEVVEHLTRNSAELPSVVPDGPSG